MKIYLPALSFFPPKSCDVSSKVKAIPSERAFRSLHFFFIDQHSFWLSKCIRTLIWEWVHRSFIIQFVSTSSSHFVSLCIYATRKDHSCNVCTVKSMAL